MRETIHDADVARHFAGGTRPVKTTLSVSPRFFTGCAFQFAAQPAVADEQQPRVRTPGGSAWNAAANRRGLCAARGRRDLADDKILRRKTKLFAERRIIHRVQKRLHRKAAENARVISARPMPAARYALSSRSAEQKK
jgi:hypothetical protein